MEHSQKNHTNQFCTFFLDHYFFGVSVDEVQEVIRHQEMTNIPLAPQTVQGLINLRGQIVMAVDLRKVLRFAKRTDGELPMNVIVKTGGEVVSFLVDKIGDVLEVSDRDYEPPPETLKGPARDLIHGAYKLDKKLLLILDTKKTLSVCI